MQEKQELSTMELVDRLNANLEQKDRIISGTDVRDWHNGASNCANPEKDVKQLLHKVTVAEDGQGSQEEHVIKLKDALEADYEVINALNFELEEERKAAAIAASETLAMISRLQKEKAALQMEALQYQRMVEEKVYYDEQAIVVMKDIILKKEEEKFALEKELGMYKRRNWSRAGSGNSLPGCNGGKDVEIKSVEESKADSSLQNDAFIDQLDYSILNQNSVIMLDTESFGDQTQIKDGYTWIDREILPLEDLGKNEKPEVSTVDYSPGSGGKQPPKYLGYTSSANHVMENDGMHEEKKLDEGGNGTQCCAEIEWTYCASASFNLDELPDSANNSHLTEHFFHGGLDETLTLQSPQDILELRRIEQKQLSQRDCMDGDKERVSISHKLHPRENGEAKIEALNSSLASPCQHVASSIFPKRFRREDVPIIRDDEVFDPGLPLLRDTDDKVWAANDSSFKIRRIDGERSTFWGGEDVYSPCVHDVYEVKDDSLQTSMVDHTKSFASVSEPNDWEFLKQYDKASESNSVLRNSEMRTGNIVARNSELYFQTLLSGVRGSNRSSSEENWIKNNSQRYVVGDRLGKPDLSSPRSNFIDTKKGSNRESHIAPEFVCQRREAASVSATEKAWQALDNLVKSNADQVFLHPPHLSSLENWVNKKGNSSMALQGNPKMADHDQVKHLALRLHSIEAERESLKEAIVSLKREIAEMQMLQGLSQLRSSFNPFKEIFSFTFWHRSVLSQLGKLACWFLSASNAGEGSGDPMGLTYILVNKGKLQATYCVTRTFKVEIVQHDHSDTILMAHNELGWPTDAHGFSETAFHGWNL